MHMLHFPFLPQKKVIHASYDSSRNHESVKVRDVGDLSAAEEQRSKVQVEVELSPEVEMKLKLRSK